MAATCAPASQPTRSPNRGVSQSLGQPVMLVPVATSPNNGLCADVVQGRGEHQFVVGSVVDRPRGSLQRVVEFVDGFLVPHSAQRTQQRQRISSTVGHGSQHTRNWSIPIVNLLFHAAILAASAAPYAGRVGRSTAMRVTIVGGGILGTAHALEAVRRGHQVIQLEREPEARGATVRNFGLVWVSGRARG